mmetsp:Transcript_6388/g.12042  ORF Transcript_6388/g.12042 Transcript_6388/m.12042 type:complete len:1804 (-) Transcript_6388:97-5508(-)
MAATMRLLLSAIHFLVSLVIPADFQTNGFFVILLSTTLIAVTQDIFVESSTRVQSVPPHHSVKNDYEGKRRKKEAYHIYEQIALRGNSAFESSHSDIIVDHVDEEHKPWESFDVSDKLSMNNNGDQRDNFLANINSEKEPNEILNDEPVSAAVATILHDGRSLWQHERRKEDELFVVDWPIVGLGSNRKRDTKKVHSISRRLQENDICPAFSETGEYQTALNELTVSIKSSLGQLFLDFFSLAADVSKTVIDEVLINLKGSDIRSLTHPISDSSDDSEVRAACARLPLQDDSCYFQINPESNLIEALVREYVPGAKEILDAIDFLKTTVKDFYENIEDAVIDALTIAAVKELYDTVNQAATTVRNVLFLDDSTTPDECLAVSKDTFAYAETSGFPEKAVYDFCNCYTLYQSGVPACTFQAYFNGLAVSRPNGLQYSFPNDKVVYFFDGFNENQLRPTGELWLALDFVLDIGKPPEKPSDATPTKCIVDFAKSLTGESNYEPVLKNRMPSLRMQTSVFVQNIEQSPDRESLVMFVLEEIDYIEPPSKSIFGKILNGLQIRQAKDQVDVNLLVLGAFRRNSGRPECNPDGFFIKVDIEVKSAVEELSTFLNLPEIRATADYGVTWNDENAEILSLFFRFNLSGYSFLGIQLGNQQIEIQYFSENEFNRRRQFLDLCCQETACNIDQSSQIFKFVTDPTVSPATTLGMTFKMNEICFANCNILKISNIEVYFIFQLSNIEDSSLDLYFQATIRCLFVTLDSIVQFQKRGDYYAAFFQLELDIDIGLVSATVVMTGAMESSNIPNRNLEIATTDRQLQSNSFLDADWDINFVLEFALDFLKEIMKFVKEVLNTIFKAVVEVVDFIVDVAKAVWDGIKRIGNEIGGIVQNAISDIARGFQEVDDPLEAIAVVGNALFDAGEALVDVAISVFNNVVAIFGDAIKAIANLLSDAFDAAEEFFVNDIWGGGLFGKGTKNRDFLIAEFDDTWNCQKRRYEVRKCSWFGAKCKWNHIRTVPDPGCLSAQAKRIDNLKRENANGLELRNCSNGIEQRNAGLKWASEGETDPNDLGLSFEKSGGALGKTSSLSPTGCKNVPIGLQVNSLATESPSFSGQKSSASKDFCLDMTDKNRFKNSYEDMVKNGIPNMAADASRGDMGIDRDVEAQKCRSKSIGECSIFPSFESNIQITHSVKCNEPLDIKGLFGEPSIKYDTQTCTRTPKVHFTLVQAISFDRDNEDDGCTNDVFSYEFEFTDCCGNEAEPLLFNVEVEKVPPTIISQPGELDTVQDCLNNIHPDVIGSPEFLPGCPGSEPDISFIDVSTFDSNTCQTTIVRTYSINECSLSEDYIQTITLENKHPPIWDFFPADVRMPVFAAYGTEETGFPTAFSSCGAGPVTIDYNDLVENGDCLSEMIIKRTFRATDICGNESLKTQIIVIGNKPLDLPLGLKKSLYHVYAGEYLLVNEKLEQETDCVLTSTKCGMGTLFTNDLDVCKCDGLDEFFEYENYLKSIQMEGSLDVGQSQVSCTCDVDDATCTVSSDIENEVIYGVQIVKSPGSCETVASSPDNVNKGTIKVRENQICPPDLHDRPAKSRIFDTPLKRQNKKTIFNFKNPMTEEHMICKSIMLVGSNDVYNMFELSIEALGKATVSISVPETSIVLVNLIPGEFNEMNYVPVTVDPQVNGTILNDNIHPSKILWNAPFPFDLKIPKRTTPYHFHGTLLGRRGEVRIDRQLEVHKNSWNGQLFANRIDAEDTDFVCAPFIGLSTCELMQDTRAPSFLPSQQPTSENRLKNASKVNWSLQQRKKPLRCPVNV